MANDVTTRDDAAVANYFQQQGAKDTSRRWIGDLLKFKKGVYEYGQEEDELDLGTKLVVVMPTLTMGWIKWGDKKPIDHRVGLVMDGFNKPARETLGDTDKSEWPTDGKTKEAKDPWAEVRYVVMVNPKDGKFFTFTASSKGGIGTIGDLMMAYGQHMRELPNELPVVELGSGSYRHETYGKVPFPTMKICDWVAGESYMAKVNEARGISTNGGATPKQLTKSKEKKEFFPTDATPKQVVAAKAKGKAKAAAKSSKGARF